jgi:hypothetical protein
MPDAEIRTILTDSQKAVWNALPKGNVHFAVNLNVQVIEENVQVEEMVDEFLDDHRPVPVMKEGAVIPAEKK